MKLYNTLSRTKQPLKPLKAGHISLYTCGPTVYHYYHIGNLRNAVFNDTLKRTLGLNSYRVDHVMNITDVGHLTSDADAGDDKLQSRADEEGKTVQEVAEFYTQAFMKDMQRMNVVAPQKYVKATDAIEQQIAMVQTLLDKGFAYQAKQAIYFDVTKLDDYGKLTGQKLDQKEVGARSDVVTDPDKHHPWDFALWFFTVGHFADHTMRWKTPWGEGFPGWHLECSAIIERELGKTIDIHTGGVDHIGTHHTNEIAQSEAAHDGTALANFWAHSEFLLVNDQKMSKSLRNTYTLDEIIKKDFSPLALRLLYLQSHYRSQQSFTWEIMQASQNALTSLHAWADLQFQNLKSDSAAKRYRELFEKFEEYMRDDLNTPMAYMMLFAMVAHADHHQPDSDTIKQYADKIDAYLGLGLANRHDITAEQKKSIQKREDARKTKSYNAAGMIRSHLETEGISIDDTPHGPRWRRIRP